MSGLDGLGWPNPEDEPKPKIMNDTPETDAEVNELKSATTYNMVWAEFARKLERERDEAREQRDAVTLRLGNTQERMIDAEMQRDRLAEAIKTHRETLAMRPDYADHQLWGAITTLTQPKL